MLAIGPIDVLTIAPMNPADEARAETDRSAGRWCDHCHQHGNHHTDRHTLSRIADHATAWQRHLDRHRIADPLPPIDPGIFIDPTV